MDEQADYRPQQNDDRLNMECEVRIWLERLEELNRREEQLANERTQTLYKIRKALNYFINVESK